MEGSASVLTKWQQTWESSLKSAWAFSKRWSTYGRTMLNPRFIVLADYPTIEHVLLKQNKAIDRAAQTTEIFKGLTPTGQIALETNEMWKHHRRIVGPAMTSKYLSLATPLANEAVMDLIRLYKVKAEVAKGRAWAVEKDMEAATMVSTRQDDKC